jgi:lactoylglutathione lyase
MNGKFTYTGIRVQDLDASIRFYGQLLGMRETGRSRFEATGGEVVSMKSPDGGPELELNYYPPGSPHYSKFAVGDGLDHLAFQVPDLDAAIREAEAAGHSVVLEMKTPSSRWAYILDPDGVYIELFS